MEKISLKFHWSFITKISIIDHHHILEDTRQNYNKKVSFMNSGTNFMLPCGHSFGYVPPLSMLDFCDRTASLKNHEYLT